MGIYFVLCLLILVSLLSLAALKEQILQSVSRRLSGDSYTVSAHNSSDHLICHDGNNLTFLISERRCVKNEELFNDCNFTITSTEEESSSHSRRLALIIDYQNDTELITAATTFNSSTNLTDAVVFYRSTDQPVNSSFCHIASLEVYRGRDQAIKIRHYGFSLSQRGTIEINHSLDYSTEEYFGELYRMNLSCSDGGLTESGCLFFKVIGTTNILNAKFDSVVLGTLSTETEDKPSVMTTSTPWTMIPITLTTNPTAIESNSTKLITTTSAITIGGNSIIEVGSTLFYIMVGAGSGILILSLIILIMFTAICFLVTNKGQSYTLAIDDQIGDRENPNLHSPQIQGTIETSDSQLEPIRFNLGSRHDSVAETASEHLYAEIRKPNHAASPSPPPLPPPLMTESMDEIGTTEENNYEANVSIPSHLKWPSKRASRAAELAYLYERQYAEFEVPFYLKRAGVTDAVNSLYDNPTSLTLTPVPKRVQSSYQKLIQGQSHDGGAEAEAQLS